jgi:hypothetical protein
MSKKLIITEEDKKSILQMYGVLSEDLFCKRNVKTTPQTLGIPNVTDVDVISLYEEDKVEQTKLNEYVTFIKSKYGKLKIPLEETCRQKSAKYAPNGAPLNGITLKGALRTSVENSSVKAYNNWTRWADDGARYDEEATLQNYAYTVPYIGMIYDFMEAWNNPESEKNNLIVTVTEENTASENIPKEKTFIDGGGAVIELPELKVQGDVFVDNKYDVTEKVTTEFQNQILNVIQEAMNSVPGIQISLVSMYVETSASRFRNTGEPAGSMTFKELAEARANTTATYMSDKLKEIGVVNVDKAPKTLNFKAEKSDVNPNGNGDGTSGPNPLEPFNFIPVGNFKMNTPGKNRKEAGTPLKSKEEYDPFKFIKVIIKIDAKVQPNTEIDKNREGEPKVWKSFAYEIKVGSFQRRRIHIPVPSFPSKPKRISGPKKKGFFSRLFRAIPEKCAAYD